MIESDQSEKETHGKMSEENIESSVSERKRIRADESDDEDERLPAKKSCNSITEATAEGQDNEKVRGMNGTTNDIAVHNDTNSTANEKDSKDKSLSVGKKHEDKTETSDAQSPKVDDKGEGSDSDNDVVSKSEEEMHGKTEDQGHKDSISEESVEDANSDSGEKDEGKDKKGSLAKKIEKSRTKDAEVVEGLELSVECASDKEPSSSSESDESKEKKPKSKTIIVKAKPNDSELDVSSSEAEKSDAQGESNDETSKKEPKKGRRKGRTSFSKAKSTGSEGSDDDVSDEDYSPRTKKRLKKAAGNKKTAKTSPVSKRGRGRGRAPVQRPVGKESDEDDNDENTKNNEMSEKKSDGAESDSGASTKNDSDEDTTSMNNKKGRKGSKQEDDKKIEQLKKYIRAAGIRVKSYNDLWTGYKSNADKAKCLIDLLESNGITGRPTLEKCKKVKLRKEKLKDVSELDTENIISEERITRARRNAGKDTTKTAGSPTKQREYRNAYKRIQNVVDSDSE